MTYLCFIYRSADSVPYFEVLPDSSRRAAISRAAEMLADRLDGLRAELWDGEELVYTLGRDARSLARGGWRARSGQTRISM